MGGKVYANVLGLLSPRPPFIRVIPLAGRYIPKAGDVVVGTVADVQGTFWLLDISAPRWAPLHMTGTPWKIDYGETSEYLRVGDSVVVAVETLESSGRIGVTMNGPGLGKLTGGTIVTISSAKVPRVIGRGGSMIQSITSATDTKVVVGQNGRIWIDGTPEAIQRVQAALRIIDEEGHRSGLTDRVQQHLETSGGMRGPSSQHDSGSASQGEGPRYLSERSEETERPHPRPFHSSEDPDPAVSEDETNGDPGDESQIS